MRLRSGLRLTWIVLSVLVSIGLGARAAAGRSHPNMVFVLFDDLGYGQPRPYVPDSEFPMPHFERLAAEGMRFTDAHSAAAVCTPTRYGILTGRYPFRIGQYGVLTTWSPPIIPPSRITVAALLKRRGYHTACFGKWHLGMNWVDGKPGTQSRVPIGAQLTDGPLALGFDVFCGFTHARNIGTIIEQNQVSAHVEAVDNQPLMIRKSLEYLKERAAHEEPFFLYFPMCPPHTPVVPADQYSGSSSATDLVKGDPRYGDWIFQGDDMLGQLLHAIARLGLADSTVVIATSDNGAEHRAYEPLRDSKRSIYEGGHRVPFVVRWPGHISPGSRCHQTVCLNDLFATAAELAGAPIPPEAGEDSVSLVPLFLQNASDTAAPPQRVIIHQSMQGDLALRSGRWKLIFHRDGRQELFDLDADLSESHDISAQHPDIVARLTAEMQSAVETGRTTPGPPGRNDVLPEVFSSGRRSSRSR